MLVITDMMRSPAVLVMLLVSGLSSTNDSVSVRSKTDHHMSTAWSFHPIFGVIGTFLNLAVLYMFIKERHGFIRIINLTFTYIILAIKVMYLNGNLGWR